jgi:nitrogen fixation protein
MPDEQRIVSFDPTSLLDAEVEVVARAQRGEIAIFNDAPMPIVRSAFLRHLLLGLPAPKEPWPVRLPGVRIRGAGIEGSLDLADCAGPGGAGLPALALEACEIAEPLDLANARIARLSLRGSRFGEIRARGARIDGALDISGAAPLNDAAWIDAHAAVIDGDLLGRGAHLRIPPPRTGIAHRDARYALRLSGAEIRGSVDLMGEFTAIGGVALDTAHVTGDVVARGARISAGEGDAIGAQAARFDGVVILGDGFVCAGVIWLMGARIAGTLDMNAARLVNRTDDGQGIVLAADTAEIGGSVLLRNGFTAEGAILLRGMRIGSSLECDGATLANATADGTGIALAADHAAIGGALLLRNGFAARGAISLIGTRIGGNLECDGASLSNATVDGTGVALVAENAVIGGAVLLRHGFKARGGVSLLNATIDSNVECCGASLENWSETGSRETLRLTNVEISGDVLLNLAFASLGHVSLWGTKIGRDLDCSTATFIGPTSAAAGRSMAGAIVATNLSVAGDMKLIGVTIVGRLDCENLRTGGNLIWDGLRFPREAAIGEARYGYRTGVDALPRILLSHARIGAALMAHDLTAEVALTIDVGGARAGTLDDAGGPAGWGVGRSREGLFCALNLDGFVYDRFGHLPSDDASGIDIALTAFGRWATHFGHHHSAAWAVRVARRMLYVQRAHVRQRLAWVRRQQVTTSEFHPQPYRQLAKVLRAQGHYQAARNVAIVEQWAAPSTNRLTRLLRAAWGLSFGFGLSPWRATMTVMVVLAIGTAGVWWAWKRADVLVVNYSYAMTEVADSPVFLHAEKGQSTAGAPPCGEADIQPVFYALDMMVPVMALHQMDKCWVDTGPGTVGWRMFWSLYSFIGKLVTSLALLTYSGVLKPREEA